MLTTHQEDKIIMILHVSRALQGKSVKTTVIVVDFNILCH